eukprot:scaffold26316_cov60-Phaeocystis_antarctica.AAC.1
MGPCRRAGLKWLRGDGGGDGGKCRNYVSLCELPYASCHVNRQGRQEPPRLDRRAVPYPHEAACLVLELNDHLGAEQLHVEYLEVRVGEELAQLLERPGRVQRDGEHLVRVRIRVRVKVKVRVRFRARVMPRARAIAPASPPPPRSAQAAAPHRPPPQRRAGSACPAAGPRSGGGSGSRRTRGRRRRGRAGPSPRPPPPAEAGAAVARPRRRRCRRRRAPR